MAGWPVAGWLASWLAGWPTGWLAGWLGGALGRPRAERIGVGGGNELRLGPWGKDYRMGEAGNRHSCQLLGGLLLRELLLLLKDCC